MKETDHAFFILDGCTPGMSLTAGVVAFRGWAWGKPGHFITDLRIVAGQKIHPVCYGHPRPDLAQYFKAREPFLLAGFDARVPILPGENLLRFEACEISGQWVELDTIAFHGEGDEPLPPATNTLEPHEFARALRLLLHEFAAGIPLSSAAETIAGYVPSPHVTRFAAVPFHGHLHHPPKLQRTEFGRVIVEGWLFHEHQEVRQVAASVDLQAWQIMEKEGDFPYVAGLFPQYPNAVRSRFYGSMDVPSQLPLPVSIRIYAELTDGSWHLCHVERTHFYDDEQAKAAYPHCSIRTFFHSVRALRSACEQHGFTVPLNRWFWRALKEVWAEYRARAPRHQAKFPGETATTLDHPARLPERLTLITHNLNLEGAPLFLLEFVDHLARTGAKLSVVSALEGPLRTRFEALDAMVEVVDVTSLLRAKTSDALRDAIRTLGKRVDLSSSDLVIANTLSAYWGVHLAQQAGKPSLLYIHESTTPDCFYFGFMAPATLPVVKETFAAATHVSFLTQATRRYYQPLLRPANHSINPGWIDLQRIGNFVAANSRTTLRKKLGLSETARVVINVGTVCNRKGQHIFVRAVDLLWRNQPELARTCEFIMVGGRDSAYDRAVDRLLTQLNRDNLRVVRETPAPEEYYGAADLFVCSSYEESFPRVVLEAMAFSVPIVSTSVHGIPEICRTDKEALLVKAGDSFALAEAMAKMLGDADLARTLAVNAKARVSENYDSMKLLPRHASLAAKISCT